MRLFKEVTNQPPLNRAPYRQKQLEAAVLRQHPEWSERYPTKEELPTTTFLKKLREAVLGAKNYWTREVKEAILDAANELGEDGHGYDGLKGYMKFLGSTEPKTFGMLIRAVMPTQVTVEHKDVKIDTVEDVEKELASIGLCLEDLRPFKFHTPEQVLELMARDVTDDTDDSK